MGLEDALYALEDEELEQETLPEEFYQLETIDSIIGDFRKEFNLKDLFDNVEQYGVAVVVPYHFKGRTYSGTIFDYRTGEPTPRKVIIHHKLVLRLSHDGFRYTELQKMQIKATLKRMVTFTRHDCGGWVVPSDAYLNSKQLVNLEQIQNDFDLSMVFYYNFTHRRIDIDFLWV